MVKSTREIHRSLGMRKSILKGRAASFLLPQKLREDDGASNQKLRAKKLMVGQCKIWTLGQRGVKYVGGNKMSKFSKMESRELSTKFY